MSQTSDGYRPNCKDCQKEYKATYEKEHPYEYRLKTMASTILKRLKYCNYDGYEHLKCYKDNNVKCLLGDTPSEVAIMLDKHFKDDITELIHQGKVPSVDRIDSKGNYEIGNIRILDYKENGKLGFASANERRKRPIKAIFKSGESKDFGSIREASRELGIDHTGIRGLADRGGVSRKGSIRFYWIDDST